MSTRIDVSVAVCLTACSGLSAPGGEPTAAGADSPVSAPPGLTEAATSTPHVPTFPRVTFTTRHLESAFYAEGATVADLNNDGAMDLIAGPLWYEGPDFILRHELAEAPPYSIESYSRFFLTFVDDVNGDGWTDVIGIAGPNGETGVGDANTHWYENPGPKGFDQHWTAHLLYASAVSNESPLMADITGDGALDLVFMTDGTLGYATRTGVPADLWVFTPISDPSFGTPYVHGLGVGDLNRDARLDIVEKSGWWEQPAEGAVWVRHTVDFSLGGAGGAQMLVFDVDADNDLDVVSSLNGHGYGLAWFEQLSADDFVPHTLLPGDATPDNFSQLHALTAADINGDGATDFVTGKRYYAHTSSNPDPGTTDPPVLYWFEGTRDPTAAFTPHLIHSDSGVGCSFSVTDVNGDGKSDIFTTSKRGTFAHVQP